MQELLSGKDYLNSMNNTLNIIMRNYSGYGYDRKIVTTIKSNFNKMWMSRAYEQASAILGFCFINEAATEYYEPHVSKEIVNKLREIFKDPYLLDDEDNDGSDYVIHSNDYLHIYFKIIELGDPDFKYEILGKENEEIDIGGYGLII